MAGHLRVIPPHPTKAQRVQGKSTAHERLWLHFPHDHTRRYYSEDDLRIIGGKLAGRQLVSPNDFRVRPTAESVRDEWMALLRDDLQDARCLDLFAGTGALGLEALSRGARSCDFVETRPASLHALKANVVALHLRDQCRIFKKDALPFAAALPWDRYDIAFVDPPYESRMLDRVIDTWLESGFARILSVEHSRRHELPPGTYTQEFDDTLVTIYQRD